MWSWSHIATLPQTDTCSSLSSGPKYKNAKQCHKNILHFDLSQKAERSLSLSFFFLFFLMWKIRVKNLIITQKPHHSFLIVWFDFGFFGFKLSWSFPTWKRGITSLPFGRRYSKESNLTPWTTESTLPQTDTCSSLSLEQWAQA